MSMMIPVIRAVMARRILVNFRVDPELLAKRVPKPFRVKRVGGWGLAGLCLIRLEAIRPQGLPAVLGWTSENVAHRIAVEWGDEGEPREGVFIPRRDSDSKLVRCLGGRLFPGAQGVAEFRVREGGGATRIGIRSEDGCEIADVAVRSASALPEDSVFRTLEQASTFFRSGCCGWSPARRGGCEGAELVPDRWVMEPLQALAAESSYFSDRSIFPEGTVRLDSVFGMTGIPHSWRDLGWMSSEDRLERGAGGRWKGTHGVGAIFRMP